MSDDEAASLASSWRIVAAVHELQRQNPRLDFSAACRLAMAADVDLRAGYNGDIQALARFDQRGGAVHLGSPQARPSYPRRIGSAAELTKGETLLVKMGPASGGGLYADLA